MGIGTVAMVGNCRFLKFCLLVSFQAVDRLGGNCKDGLNGFRVCEERRFMEKNLISVPMTGEVAAANINLALVEKGSAINDIIRDIAVVKDKGFDCVDLSVVGEFRKGHIVQEDIVLGLKGTHGGGERVGINRE